MAARKARKPKHQKSEYPTLPGQLGYLNSYYCPVCGKHLFSAYDKDMKKDREDGYYFHVSNDFNYCSKCGQLLDLDEWKRKEEPPEAAEGSWKHYRNGWKKYSYTDWRKSTEL